MFLAAKARNETTRLQVESFEEGGHGTMASRRLSVS
jgi:hypothetical protein